MVSASSCVTTSPLAADAPIAGKTHQIRTIQAFDADEHAHNLTDWEQSYDQITPGHFHGRLTELQLPQMQVFREDTSQAVHQSCCVWPDTFWFGLPVQTGQTRINGRLVGPHSIMVRPGHCEFELQTPSDYVIYGIVMRQDNLQHAAERGGCLIDWAKLAQAEVMQVAPHPHQRLLQRLAGLLQHDGPYTDPAWRQQLLLNALLALLDTSKVDPAVSNSFQRRQRIVAKARDLVLSQHDQTLTVPELCERLFVSRRTLQYCFEDVLGMSPMQYLRLVRLNTARRRLRQSSAQPVSVQDVAADLGFWHVSQFSCDYRKLFGQTPSQSRQMH
ncbi:helix-turn-helix domain-containing protein [Rhodoferax sp. U11-2br]|uniref:helix-turn-helix domain-containing protein n=1 Tax=Rhodoferax sp. U11-2br TaxID=2838878 RepID=UPI001BEB6F3F|nr:helix-turn-helix domain-containing protein [Rhodoferax sp. U11-2br]MBT3067313.1 helix-turn-helix domain-containing protein [Rhodoferax sp. U11-2br]